MSHVGYATVAGMPNYAPKIPRFYVTPNGAGAKNGTSWANASAGLGAVNGLIARAAATNPAGEVWVRADLGPYEVRATTFTLDKGGVSADREVRIRGVDASGNPMKAEVLGTRVEPWTINNPGSSAEVFRLNSGANYLYFSDFHAHNTGNGFVRVRMPIKGLRITDCTGRNISRFLENNLGGGATHASIAEYLVLQRITVRGYADAFARIAYATENILCEDLYGDSERQDKSAFAIGIGLRDTAGPAMFRRCTMKNHIDTSKAYQNGDGFSGEAQNHNVTFEDCIAANNTDGGWDFKGDNIRLIRCQALGNHRNYRMWGISYLVDCIGTGPMDNAGTNPYSRCQVGSYGGACYVIGGRYTGNAGYSYTCFSAEAGGTIAYSRATVTSDYANFKGEESANDGKHAGRVELMTTTTSKPVLNVPTTYSFPENLKAVIPITANMPGALATLTGPYTGLFGRNGYWLSLKAQDYEAATPKTMQQPIRFYGINQQFTDAVITVNITDVQDDPMNAATLFGPGGATDGGWWDCSVAGTSWIDIDGTVPAVDGSFVARLDDISGRGRHMLQPDVTKQAVFRDDGTNQWLEVEKGDWYAAGSAGDYRFPNISMYTTIRRATDTATRPLWGIPRSLNASTGDNFAVGMWTNGGASLRVRVGGSSVFCSSNSAVTNRDISISFQHNPGLAHTNNVQMLNREPDPGPPNYAAGIGGVMRFFTDGSFAPGYTGRFYAAVCTNRTDPEDIRFRIHRQLAQQIGVKFAA